MNREEHWQNLVSGDSTRQFLVEDVSYRYEDRTAGSERTNFNFAMVDANIPSHIVRNAALQGGTRTLLRVTIQGRVQRDGQMSRGRVLPAGCDAAGEASIAAFRVPRDSGDYLDTEGNVSFIHYYNHEGSVRRCGPPVQRNGVLNHAAGLGLHDGVAVRDGIIELVSCHGQNTNSRQLVYRLVYPEGYEPACSIARARTVFIR